ncbi:hypothetical protein ACOSQ4_013127 [Xanthoceras sorbifolium]
MMGVEMAAKETKAKLLTGSLGLIAGALRIAISELVSVYTQVDTVTFQANRDLKRLARDHDHDHERTWQLMVPSPAQVALTSSLAYLLVGTVPLLASGFVEDHNMRQCIAIISASLSMLMVGVIAAVLGRASIAWSCARVLIGGLTAILIMWGKMKALGFQNGSGRYYMFMWQFMFIVGGRRSSYHCGGDEGGGCQDAFTVSGVEDLVVDVNMFAFGAWLRAFSPPKRRSSGSVRKETAAELSRTRVVPPVREASTTKDLDSNAHVVQDVDLCGGKVPEFIEAIPVTPTVEVSRNATILIFFLRYMMRVFLSMGRRVRRSTSIQGLDVQHQLHGLDNGFVLFDEGLGLMTGVVYGAASVGVGKKLGWKRKVRVKNIFPHSFENAGLLGTAKTFDESRLFDVEISTCCFFTGQLDIMKHFCWNVRGLGYCQAFTIMRLLKYNHELDLMFLMETKIDHCMAESISIKLDYVGKLVMDNIGKSGGLLLFWSDNVTVDLLFFSCFYIDVQVTYLRFWKSDHRPLLIEFDVCTNRSMVVNRPDRRRLHFEACWMNENGCQQVIKSTWDQLGHNFTLNNVASCLHWCLIKLKHWYSIEHCYFTKLFSCTSLFREIVHSDSPSFDCMEWVLAFISTCLSARSSRFLDGVFTREQIHKALFDMSLTKSPGLDDSQSAFIPGRLISDNAIVGFECLYTLKRKVGRVKGFFALKLDMSKACDRVKWRFLELMMLRLGFSLVWVDRIMRCVRKRSNQIVLRVSVVIGGLKIKHLFFFLQMIVSHEKVVEGRICTLTAMSSPIEPRTTMQTIRNYLSHQDYQMSLEGVSTRMCPGTARTPSSPECPRSTLSGSIKYVGLRQVEKSISGSHWRIGNGSMGSIYKDRWLPCPSTFKPCSLPNIGDCASVNQLKSPSGGWDVDLIKSVFFQVDVDSILNIPPCSTLTNDVLVWHFDLYGRIWFVRNKKVHGNHKFVVEDVVNWSYNFLQDFIVANSTPTVASYLHASAVRWSAPADNCWKINTDASICSAQGKIGFCILIHKHSGAVMASSPQYMEGSFSVAIAEALGVLRGL